MYNREYLVLSQVKQASYCLPCRLLWHTTGEVSSRSALASPGGLTASAMWRILIVRIRKHEEGKSHGECYIALRENVGRLLSMKGVDSLLEARYLSEAVKLCNVLKRIINAVLFLWNVVWYLVDHHIGLGIQAMVTS